MDLIAQPPGLADLPMFEVDGRQFQVDLGDDHWMRFICWNPDLSIEGNAQRWGHLADLIAAHPVCGAIVGHVCKTETGIHEGCINFRTEVTQHWEQAAAQHCWVVHSWNPLHVEPSLLSHCPCGDHGFIRGGRWVRA